MIGQTKLRNTLSNVEKLPHFIILVGSKGSGKKLLANEVAHNIATNVIQLEGTGIEQVRSMITDAYHKRDMCYIIPDADGMSVGGKNALLKVTEEPPNNVYFIMTLQDTNNTLPTITSRGTVYHMENYDKSDLKDYLHDKYKVNNEVEEIVLSVCDTPGEINELMVNNPEEFYRYVQLVLDNIAEVSGANAFKIPDKVALKENTEGFDLRLFWKLFVKKCFDISFETTGPKKLVYLHWVGITSRYLQDLRTKAINKQMLMDKWILDVRKEAIDGYQQSA